MALAWPFASASAAVEPVPFSLREPPYDAKISGLLTDAQTALRQGETRKALQILNLAQSLAPNNPYILARFATVLSMYGDPQGALDRLRRARRMGVADDVVLGPMLEAMLSLGQYQNVLDLYPDPGPKSSGFSAGMILRARASAMQVLGDSAGASAAMKRSLAILKDYDGVMTAGRIALMQGNFDQADLNADEALKLRPQDLDARMLKINLALLRRQTGKSQQMAEKLVADHPLSLAALLTRIKVYLATDRADKAEIDIDRIIAEQPRVQIARYFKSIVLARHNDVSGAWDIAHSLPKEYIQTDPGVALNVASMAVAAGYLDSAASILNVAVFRFPHQMEARLLLADLRLRQKSPQHAENVMQLVKDSRDPRVMITLARIALMKKDRVTAQKYIERVLDGGGGEELRALDKDIALKSIADYLARHPGNRTVKKQYALLLMMFGEAPKARVLYEKLVLEDKTDALAFNNLAWLVVQENPRRALGLAQNAVKANPALANYLDTLGTMQLNQSDFRGAVVSLQKAHDLAPDNANFAYHLALALEATGATAQSQALLQVLVKRGGFSDLEAAKNLLASKLKLTNETQVRK